MAGIEPLGLDPNTSHRFHIQGWLNPVQYFNSEYHQTESFLLLTSDEWELGKTTNRAFSQLQPDYFDNNFVIIRYESSEAVHRYALDN